ncbi:unnamed protein product [Calypogeia fissa]
MMMRPSNLEAALGAEDQHPSFLGNGDRPSWQADNFAGIILQCFAGFNLYCESANSIGCKLMESGAQCYIAYANGTGVSLVARPSVGRDFAAVGMGHMPNVPYTRSNARCALWDLYT